MSKQGDRDRCHHCMGYITFHADDPEHPWKHDFPEVAFRCAKERPRGEETVPMSATRKRMLGYAMLGKMAQERWAADAKEGVTE